MENTSIIFIKQKDIKRITRRNRLSEYLTNVDITNAISDELQANIDDPVSIEEKNGLDIVTYLFPFLNCKIQAKLIDGGESQRVYFKVKA